MNAHTLGENFDPTIADIFKKPDVLEVKDLVTVAPGLVQSVTIVNPNHDEPYAHYQEIADWLRYHPVQKLKLEGFNLTRDAHENTMKGFEDANFRHLKELDLSGCNLSKPSPAFDAKFAADAKAHSLAHTNPGDMEEVFLSPSDNLPFYWPAMPALETLNISNTMGKDAINQRKLLIDMMYALPTPSLRRMDLSDNHLTQDNVNIAVIRALKDGKFPNLEPNGITTGNTKFDAEIEAVRGGEERANYIRWIATPMPVAGQEAPVKPNGNGHGRKPKDQIAANDVVGGDNTAMRLEGR